MLEYFFTPFGFWYGFVYMVVFSLGIQAFVQCFFLLKMTEMKQAPIYYILYALVVYAMFFLGIALPPISEFSGSLLGVLSVFFFARFILKQITSVSVFLAFLVMTVNILVESILTPLLSIFVRMHVVSEIILTNINLWGSAVLSIAVFFTYTKLFAIDETIKSKLLWILSAPLLFICLILRPYIAISYPNIFRYGQAINDTSLSDDIWALVISAAALLTVSSILFAYKKLILQSKIENDAILLNTQIAAQKLYVEELKQRYDATGRFRHDLKNHISILSGLITEREFEKATDYIARFNDGYERMTFQISTGNMTLDILLSEKLYLAQQNDITLKVDIDIGGKVQLDNFDLCTIFANAIENAIKGAKSANKENRSIDITAKPNKGFYIIDIINGFDEINYEKGSGIGITTIKMISEKYNGYVDISSRDKTFRLSILLPLA